MSVSRAANGSIVLAGACPNEDAEPLLQLLLETPAAPVDWRRCTAAHSAVIQLLLAARPVVQGPPANAALARWVAPAIDAGVQ